jgi:hypothetical protein
MASIFEQYLKRSKEQNLDIDLLLAIVRWIAVIVNELKKKMND